MPVILSWWLIPLLIVISGYIIACIYDRNLVFMAFILVAVAFCVWRWIA